MKKKNVIAIIPARMGSSRYPGKPLALILGKPMIWHVYERAKQAQSITDVYIATCDSEIETYCKEAGLNVVMTKDTHERASDRAAEAMVKIEKALNVKIDILVMVQGDEPMISPSMVDDAVHALIDEKEAEVVNLMAPLETREEAEDPNEVKVVVDQEGYALYFSREAIPSEKKVNTGTVVPVYKQVCIIPFTRAYLLEFNALPQTPLEIIESVDMLRVLEHGKKVKMVMTHEVTYSVDTPDDLRAVEEAMQAREI